MKRIATFLTVYVLFLVPLQKASAQTFTPSIIWATYFGSPSDDNVGNFAFDSQGNIVFVSYVSSSGAPTTSGVHQTTHGGKYDVMLTKFDQSGKLVWSTSYGGEENEFALNIDINTSDEIIVSGTTNSITNISTKGSYNEYKNGNTDGFLAKFSNNGNLLWATYFGGSNYEYPIKAMFDHNGEIIVCGYTNSTNNISSRYAFQPINGGKYDAFIAKFSSNGLLIWSTYYGGLGDDYFTSLSITEDNKIIAVGTTTSEGKISTSSVFQHEYSGNRDGIIIKFDTDGNRIFGSYFGGDDSDELFACASDKFGNYYVIGAVFSKGLATIGFNLAGERDILIAKFNKDGQRIWATYFGGNSADIPNSITLDDNGDLLISAMSKSFDFPTSENANKDYYSIGIWNAVFMKLDTAGRMKWSTIFGGYGDDKALYLSRGKDGFLYGSVSTDSPDLATNGAFQKVLRKNDAMLVKMRESSFINAVDLEHYPVISIYPNPTTDFLKFKDLQHHDIKNLTICSATGQVICQYIHSIPELIDISQLTANKYWVIVEKVSGEIMSNSFVKM